MKSYFDLLNQDLQEHIFDIKNKMTVFDNMQINMNKNQHKQKFSQCFHEIWDFEKKRYSFNEPRYDDFDIWYDDDTKSVTDFSDQLLYCSKEIVEIRNKYPKIVIDDLFPIANVDLQEAKQIEKIRRFLYLIS